MAIPAKYEEQSMGCLCMWITCTCGREYFIKGNRYPSKDIGGSLECTECSQKLHSWGKDTRDYSLFTREEIEASVKWEQAIQRIAPKCICGLKMKPTYGAYGWFWGCVRFPHGCNYTKTCTGEDIRILNAKE